MQSKKGISTLILAAISAAAMAQGTGVIKEVVVRGNVNISADAIKVVMRSAPGKPFIQSDLSLDEKAISDLGWFKDVKVLSRPVSDTEYQVMVDVEENPVIKEIRIVGNTVFKAEEIAPLIAQEKDKVYNLRNVEPSANAIAKLYSGKGYFALADIGPMPDSPETLNVQILERQVNDIEITGLVRTKKRVVEKLIRTKPGQAFNENTWINDYRRLESTQWFKTIDVGTRPTNKPNLFDLLLDVKEERTAQIGFGAALDPQSRLAGNVRYSDTNFRGMGQNFNIYLQQDTVGSGLSTGIDYVNPWIDSRDTAMSISLYSRVNNYFGGSGIGSTVNPVGTDERFDERRTGGSLSFTRMQKDIYATTLGINYQGIKTVNNTTTTTNFIQQDGTLLTGLLQYAVDRRDVPLDPAEGDYFRVAMEPAFSDITKIGGAVAGNTSVLGRHSFLRGTIEYKKFWSKRPTDPKKIYDARRVLAFRARVAAIKGTTPFFEQLFVGGADSLRGYPDQRFWGTRMVLTSLEYRMPIQKTFSIIPFADLGGAWGGYGTINDFDQSSKFKLHFDYGVGIGFRTPLGSIRVDFGFNPKGSRTGFSIGGGF